jgi:phosphate starvation-inducible protein PhoH and related proteins
MSTKEIVEVDFDDTNIQGLDVAGIKKGRKQIKNKIQFNLSLNAEQKEVKAKILQDTISVLIGKAGSGKTLLATQIALEALFYREVERVIITRPTVSNEDIGFLPGSMKEKMDPWLSPIQANMIMLTNKAKIEKMMGDDTIEISPISFLRGRTFVNSFVIVDESQNVTKTQMEMILSRLGVNSKMILTGDSSQTDLKNKKDSGLPYLLDMSSSINGLGVYELKTNHRHPIVEEILKHFDDTK